MFDVINSFLFFGFVPDSSLASKSIKIFDQYKNDTKIDYFDNADFKSAKTLLLSIIEDIYKKYPQIAIPLSYGLDSRGILGAALEVYDPKNIFAYTLGHPDSHDYENALFIARKFLPKNNYYRINMTTENKSNTWDTDMFVERVKKRENNIILGIGEFGPSPHSNSLNQDFSSLPKLSGFFGGSVSGQKIPRNYGSNNFNTFLAKFISANQCYKSNLNIISPEFDPYKMITKKPFLEKERISYFDQLHWGYKQTQRIIHFVGPSKENIIGKRVIAPYYDPRWIKSFLNLDTNQRINQRFYLKFLYKSFPHIFPDKFITNYIIDYKNLYNFYNRIKAKIKSKHFHVDMNLLIQNDDFKKFLIENLNDLNNRKIIDWVDFENILKRLSNDLIKPTDNVGRGLYALASLEINLKAEKIKT